MGKCLNCGEWNADKNDFCSACGRQLSHGNAPEALNVMEEARKQFEQDSLVSLDRNRITFVCEICGTVNSIDNRVCSKCGKPRPRNELVTALRRLRESEQLKNAPTDPEEEVAAVADTVAEPEPQSEPEPAPQPVPYQLFRYEGGAFPGLAMQQNAPTVQPFVIVPYVNQFQPLYQYVPGGQLMRFEPAVKAEAPAPAPQPVPEQQIMPVQEAPKKQKGLRFANFVTGALSAAAILIVFLLTLINGVGVREPLFEGVPAVLNKLFGLSLPAGNYVIGDWTTYLAPIGLAVGVLFAFILFLTSFIQLIRNKWTGASTAFAVFAFAATATGTMGLLAVADGLKSLSAFLDAARIGLYALWGVIVALVIVTAIVTARVNAYTKKMKKAAVADVNAAEAAVEA